MTPASYFWSGNTGSLDSVTSKVVETQELLWIRRLTYTVPDSGTIVGGMRAGAYLPYQKGQLRMRFHLHLVVNTLHLLHSPRYN